MAQKTLTESIECSVTLPFDDLCVLLDIVQNNKRPKGCDMIHYSSIIATLTNAMQTNLKNQNSI